MGSMIDYKTYLNIMRDKKYLELYDYYSKEITDSKVFCLIERYTGFLRPDWLRGVFYF